MESLFRLTPCSFEDDSETVAILVVREVSRICGFIPVLRYADLFSKRIDGFSRDLRARDF